MEHAVEAELEGPVRAPELSVSEILPVVLLVIARIAPDTSATSRAIMRVPLTVPYQVYTDLVSEVDFMRGQNQLQR